MGMCGYAAVPEDGRTFLTFGYKSQQCKQICTVSMADMTSRVFCMRFSVAGSSGVYSGEDVVAA